MLAGFLSILSWLLGWFKKPSSDQQLGTAVQQRDAEVMTAHGAAAEAQAEVDAPKTQDQLEQRLQNGTF